MPERVLFTPAALQEAWGQQILSRVQSLNLPIEELPRNRLTGLRGEDERETYNKSKRTLAIVTAPPSAFKLSPIPPSADWQFHIAEGCPAHCQYCYLAGSLSGPPVIRVFANLPQILDNLAVYEQAQKATTYQDLRNRPPSPPNLGGTGFTPPKVGGSGGQNDGICVSPTYEVSCYTDPLGIEHLTGSLNMCIRHFGTRENGHLRWVSKFDAVDELLDLPHNGHTRCRMSVNAAPISGRFEGGTASVTARLQALRRLALPRSKGGGGYPVGLVIAPIMPIDDWMSHYERLFDQISVAFDFNCDLTFELISHRFTPGSKEVLQQWYPQTSLDMDEATRSVKRNKFGGTKYVYSSDTMKMLRRFFEGEIAKRFPLARVLYWT